MLLYLPIFVFAILEGEVYYTTMCVAAAAGKLNWTGVLVAGALGGSTGDQLWYLRTARPPPMARSRTLGCAGIEMPSWRASRRTRT